MRYSEEFKEKVREANNIVDVIGGYVKLQRAGSVYKGLCPFHGEKTASFTVFPTTQTYHCFGCHKGGDVFSFIEEYEALNYGEAVNLLAARAGIDIPTGDMTESQKKDASVKKQLLDIQKYAATFYFKQLQGPSGENALKYLKARGLSGNIITRFGLGYAGGKGELYKALKEQGYSDALLKETGLFIYDGGSGKVREKFWSRVMFPIMDLNRRVIGFGGRVMGDGEPKYLNSPQTKLFDKGRNLYALYAAKASRQKTMIICEGYMDVISLHQAGFTNAVASLGTALTSAQCALIRRYVTDVYLLYDSDGAGVKAALRAIPLLKEAGIDSKVVDLKPYKDPDELLKDKGANELKARLDKAQNGIMFEIHKAFESYDMNDPTQQSRFYHDAAKKLARLDDEIERNTYLQSVSKQYHIDIDVLKRQTGKSDEPEKSKVVSDKTNENPALKDNTGKSGSASERKLLSWMCKSPDIIGEVSERLDENDFSDGVNRKLAGRIFRMYKSGGFKASSIIQQSDENADAIEAARIIECFSPPGDKTEAKRALKELILKIKGEALDRVVPEVSDPDYLNKMQKIWDEKKALEKQRALL